MSRLATTLLRLNTNQIKFYTTSCPGSEPPKRYSKRMIKFKKLQEKFQRDDGKPIFLKGGPSDRILYLSTLGLCVVALILDFKYYIYYATK